jgi:hypothetical protein
MTELSEISDLAKIVRKQIQKKCSVYYEPKNLGGACGTASLHLMRCARKNGISVRFVHGKFNAQNNGNFTKNGNWMWHAWTEYRGHVIDITMTQFYRDMGLQKGPRVRILPFDKAERYYDLTTPGIRTRLVGKAWSWIKGWAVYPEDLRKDLVILK